jgi:hypothetical protein
MSKCISIYGYIKLLPNFIKNIELDDVGLILENIESSEVVKILLLRINMEMLIDKNHIQLFDISLCGDMYTHKICDRCFKYLNTKANFENNRIKKDNIITKRPSCRTCRKQKNGIPISAKDKRSWEETKPQSYELFTCPICQKRTIAGVSKIVLDHNHTTGQVRGWLCESCNTGIGRFDDHEELVSNALNWLRSSK